MFSGILSSLCTTSGFQLVKGRSDGQITGQSRMKALTAVTLKGCSDVTLGECSFNNVQGPGIVHF